MITKKALAEELIDQINKHDFSDCHSKEEKIAHVKQIAQEFKLQHQDEISQLASEKLTDEQLESASGGSFINDLVTTGKDAITSIVDIGDTVYDVFDEIF